METIDNNDNEYIARHESSGSRSISVVALVVGIGIAAVLFWMSLSLSSHVSKLEESIVSLQKSMGGEGSKELADVSNQLGKLTEALNDHLNSQPANMEMAVDSPAMASPSESNISPQASPSLAANQSKNDNPLPAPISSSDIAQPKPSSGNWIINLASVSNSKSADQEVARLGKMDIKAEVSRAESKGKVWYRIQVPGYASHDEAINARPALEEKLGISGTWVGQRK